MRCVELLQQGQGVGVVLSSEHGGKLSAEDGAFRLQLQGGADQLFGFRVLFALDQDMGKAGVCGDRLGIAGEYAAIGSLGCIVLA